MTYGTDAHVSVLAAEVLEGLNLAEGDIAMDLTGGMGGHAAAIAERVGPGGRLVVMDRDPAAVAVLKQRFIGREWVVVRQGAFSGLEQVARSEGVHGSLRAILMDLGVSSPQLDDAERGFSFRTDGPLDMRMDPTTGRSCADWLAEAREEDIADVIYRYGEDRHSRRIARALVYARQVAPIRTTAELARIVRGAVRSRERLKDPATRTFQAFRIHTNRELDELEAALPQAVDALASGGRLVAISFHSLEDRIVKHGIRETENLRKIGGLVRPSEPEARANSRARSARLRVAEKVAGAAETFGAAHA